MPLGIPIGTSSGLGTPTIEMSSSPCRFLILLKNQTPKATTATTATAPIAAPAMMALFRPSAPAPGELRPVVLLLGGGDTENSVGSKDAWESVRLLRSEVVCRSELLP